MQASFLYNALTDCRVAMVAAVCTSPDGRLFLVYENHGSTARGLFLDENRPGGSRITVPPGETFDVGVIGPGSLKEYQASGTGHTPETPDAKPSPRFPQGNGESSGAPELVN